MLVHSYIYYEMDTNLISDSAWQQWANELVELQKVHKEPIGYYDEAFSDWDGSTGYHLPRNDRIRATAARLLEEHARRLICSPS